MVSIRRRLAVLALALPLLPLPVTAIGCGGSDQTTGITVAPTEQAKAANSNMEDFMKKQDTGKKK